MFDDNIWKLASTLEFLFNCRIYTKVYISPLQRVKSNDTTAKCELFDCFFLQVEGCSSWTLVEPSNERKLPRVDLGVEESKSTKTSEVVVLQKGDLLYLPKGWLYSMTPIDVSKTTPSAERQYSLILSLQSASESYSDLLNTVLPQAVERAAQNHLYFRQSIPFATFQYMGVSTSNDYLPDRKLIDEKISAYLNYCMKYAMTILDPAVDQLKKTFIAQRLPVPLTAKEEANTSMGRSDAVIHSYTVLRMLRPGIAISIVEDGMVVVYHCMDNSRELYGAPLNPLEFELDDGPSIETLLNAYPKGICIADVHHPSEEVEDVVSIAQSLYKEGFLIIEDELSAKDENLEGDSTSDENDPF